MSTDNMRSTQATESSWNGSQTSTSEPPFNAEIPWKLDQGKGVGTQKNLEGAWLQPILLKKRHGKI